MERIQDVNVAEQSDEDIKSYAIYVAKHRVTPDIIDGLKPVNRRILWCAANDFKGQGFIKTISIMGRVVEKYNPHGDAAVQMAIRNMINDFSTKYPTMLGEGSWGSKANPYPAAPRYNGCKLSPFAIDVFFDDLYDDKRTVDWIENYTNTCLEPAYLPAKIPTLLILGQMGIGVGFKPTIPSHNLGDVIDVTIKLMKDPNAPFCLIPDECMPCEIFETDFQKINDTGVGTYVSRGIIDIGEYNKNPALYIRSLPDYTFFNKIKDSIISLVASGKMPYIIDMISKTRDVEEKDGSVHTIFEEIIVLKKGADPNFVKAFLYANTRIKETRQVRLIVIKDNNIVYNISYREYLLNFINFRRITIARKMNAKMQTLKTAIHEKELYIKAITSGSIDKIIDMIRKQDSRNEDVLVEFLIKKLDVTPLQAKFLLRTNIAKLSKGYVKQYQKELDEYNKRLNYVKSILTNPEAMDQYIIDEMLEIKRKYNTPKVCRVISSAEASGIAPGTFKLLFSKKNFIKKIGEFENITSFTNDEMKFGLTVDNAENILIFSELGKVFKQPVHKIPITVKGSNGIDVRVLNKYCTSNITCAAREVTLQNLTKTKYKNFIFIITQNGYIKKIDIEDILSAQPSGIIYSKLDNGDRVKDILFGPDKMDILIYSGPKVLRISSKEVPYLKRSTKGNRASTAATKIDGMNFVLPESTELVIVTNEGYVNRIPMSIIQRSSRGRAGTKVIRLKKDDTIKSIWPCREESTIVVFEDKTRKEFPVRDIQLGSTISTGIKLCENPTKITLQI